MATRDEPPTGKYANDLARVKTDTAAVIRARTRLAEAETKARKSVADALISGHAAGRHGFRTEVQQASPFSPPVVRDIGDKAGLPPDDRYVRTSKTAD